jgi:hypothetical protein
MVLFLKTVSPQDALNCGIRLMTRVIIVLSTENTKFWGVVTQFRLRKTSTLYLFELTQIKERKPSITFYVLKTITITADETPAIETRFTDDTGFSVETIEGAQVTS